MRKIFTGGLALGLGLSCLISTPASAVKRSMVYRSTTIKETQANKKRGTRRKTIKKRQFIRSARPSKSGRIRSVVKQKNIPKIRSVQISK